MENFTELHYILGVLLLGYGLTLGFRNTTVRLVSAVLFRGYNQSPLGAVLDSIFYAGIGYLVLVYFGIC